MGFDFALLGLNARESRVEVIRQAAAETAARIQLAAAKEPDQRDAMLCDLATSTYRLLDPRRRQRPMERIQLSLFGDSDIDRQQQARRPLLHQSLVRAEAAECSASDEVQLREAKQEIVQQLLLKAEASRRVGAIAGSLLMALVCGVATSLVLLSV